MTASPTEPEELESEDEFGVTLLEAYAEVDLDAIKAASPKRYIGAARAGGFAHVQAGISRTLEKRPPFKGGKSAGDSRPDVEVEHLWLRAWTEKAAYFCIHFQGNRFADATVWDAVGWPKELWVDYAPSARDLAQFKDEPAKMWQSRAQSTKDRARDRSFNYNDGEFWTDPNPRSVSATAEFELWLADMVPSFEPRKKPVSKKQKQASATAVELIQAGEWFG